MSSFNYTNAAGKKIPFTSVINLCETREMMSFCRASTEQDQYGCTYREDSPQSHIKRCMYYRENTNGVCDNMWAQNNLEKPK